jgi:hypothetical protein
VSFLITDRRERATQSAEITNGLIYESYRLEGSRQEAKVPIGFAAQDA